jgi:hypothetical protein
MNTWGLSVVLLIVSLACIFESSTVIHDDNVIRDLQHQITALHAQIDTQQGPNSFTGLGKCPVVKEQ